MKKTYLIAGGAGFIGSNLVEKLLKNKTNKVIVIDNLSSGKLQNLEEFFNNKNFKFMKHDIKDPFVYIDDLDYVFNLASPASPIFYQATPVETLLANSQGTYNLIKLAHEKKATFFHTSTSEVYGDPKVHPQIESYWGNVNPIGERACYDEGKRFSEALITSYARVNKDFDFRIVRIFNTYGPKMSSGDGRVIPNFINQALKNKDIPIYGDGSQTRSFCYIDDMLDGFLALLKSNVRTPVNLGNPNEKTVKELANIIIKLTNSKSKLVYKNLPKDDPTRRKPDITLAKTKLKWSSKVGLAEGLRHTIKYFE